MTVKPIRLRAKLQNNRILRALEELGHTQASFCRATGCDYMQLSAWINMRQRPISTAYHGPCMVEGCENMAGLRMVTCRARKHSKLNKELRDVYLSSPDADVTWTASARELASQLATTPGYLWPDEMQLVRSTGEKVLELSMEDVANLVTAAHEMGRLDDSKVAHLLLESSGLTDREEYVLRRRFFDEKGLEECGEDMGVTRERVRQIEAKALRKIRIKARQGDVHDMILDG